MVSPRSPLPGLSTAGAAIFAVLLLVYLIANGAWIEADLLLFDGDESGHVGAAELFAAMWREGRGGEALWTTVAGKMGVYPPLYAGVVGIWWAIAGSGPPADVLVRGVNLLWPLLAAVAVLGLTRPLGKRAMLAGFLAVLALPLLCGLGRHFMLEGALAAAVAWCAFAVEHARARPSAGRMVFVGVTVGIAYLCKQTAPLYLLPLLIVRLPWKPLSLLALGVAALIAAPWTLANLGEQLGYGSESAAGTPGIALLRHASFYPWSLLWVAAGPPLLLLGVAGGVAGARSERPARGLLWLALAWLVGALVLLGFVPRKYPRLMAPALPAIGVLVALAVARWRRGWRAWLLGAGLLVAVGWTSWGSVSTLPVPASARVLDDRCPQVWLRPPGDSDYGLGRVIEALRHSRPGPVLVVGTVELPCAVQTTHDWSSHLSPAMRFAGVDREIVTDPGEPAALAVSWEGPIEGYEGEALVFPELEDELWIGKVAR